MQFKYLLGKVTLKVTTNAGESLKDNNYEVTIISNVTDTFDGT